MNRKQKYLLARIIIAIGFIVVLTALDKHLQIWMVKFVAYLIPYLVVGYDILGKAIKGIKNRQVFDENFLMSIATIGAFGVGIYDSIYTGSGDYLEAVAVMLLYQVGELFQSCAIGKSRKNIAKLMDIRPDYANLEENGTINKVDPDEVEIGSIIVVSPGEKVPIDGVVISGDSALNTAALTGESIPRNVSVDDMVLSGYVNINGVLRIRTTADFDESTASKILDLVENAASRKSKSENFISKFAKYYTPIVCYLALALLVLPPAVLFILGQDMMIATWAYRACTFLVISCPCAVVISVPLSFFAGLGGASREGILIKGSNYLEALSDVAIVAFDKTGTITKGNFEVADIQSVNVSKEELLYYAAHIESHSSHPISQSLKNAYGKEIDATIVGKIEEISGKGVKGIVSGKAVAAGNKQLMLGMGISGEDIYNNEIIGTVVYIVIDGEYAGKIIIKDEIKPESVDAIRMLEKIGIRNTVMLTGDMDSVAREICEKTGIKECFANLLPGEKVEKLEELLNKTNGKEKLAYVGDGINDAPVLSRSDIGIAMGALGSDAAIEAADVVIMDDNPKRIAKAIGISQKCIRIVKENIVFSMGVKIICLGLGAIGLANMWIAIFADVGVMIIAVLNAIRCLCVKKIGGIYAS